MDDPSLTVPKSYEEGVISIAAHLPVKLTVLASALPPLIVRMAGSGVTWRQWASIQDLGGLHSFLF